MSEILKREEYIGRRSGCAPADTIKPGLFFVEVSRLLDSVDPEEEFARELFVKVMNRIGEDGFPTVILERLTDDGRPVGEEEVTVDPDGILFGPQFDERGFLIGGTEASEDGLNLTKEELFALIPITNLVRLEQIEMPGQSNFQ